MSSNTYTVNLKNIWPNLFETMPASVDLSVDVFFEEFKDLEISTDVYNKLQGQDREFAYEYQKYAYMQKQLSSSTTDAVPADEYVFEGITVIKTGRTASKPNAEPKRRIQKSDSNEFVLVEIQSTGVMPSFTRWVKEQDLYKVNK
jgi:hypothetical protein